MRITFIGTGYVGLVSGACFAELGFKVTCVDKSKQKIETLKKGVIPIYEPGLERLVQNQMELGRLVFTSEIEDAVKEAHIVFIAVGTPSRRGDGHADLSFVYKAVEEILQSIDGYTVIVMKSTVPIGTAATVKDMIAKLNPSAECDVVSNPEFLREGSAVEDFLNPDRIIVGLESERAKRVLNEVYRPLHRAGIPVLFTDLNTAEMIKYSSNSFLATKITFINEISNLCEKMNANITDVSKGMGLDRRIGAEFLRVGPGYGGSCFPKDTRALIETAKENEVPLKIIESVDQVNSDRKIEMADKIDQACGGLKGKTLAILGLTFKANTDDMRESVSLSLIPELQKRGAKCRVYDPQALKVVDQHFQDVIPCEKAQACMKGADAAVILTEWNEFKTLNLKRVSKHLNMKLLIDLRNLFEEDDFKEIDLTYVSLGRQTVASKQANVVEFKKPSQS